jgi:hypothetical protein
MVVQFDATIDDVVDVAMRSSVNSKAMRGWRLQGAAVTSLLAGFPVYLLLPWTPLLRFAIACGCGLVAGAVTLWTANDDRRTSLYKICREQFGTELPFTVTVELLDEGLSFKERGTRVIYGWSLFERLEESDDCLYFFFRDHTCGAVRKRGFESLELKDEFLKQAESYIHRSRGPHCSTS